MKDLVGKYLLNWRIKAVSMHVRGRLLDIGCGTNDLVRTYEGEGAGVDVYQWGTVDWVVEDSSKLPFEDNSFDTVSIIAALNHIPNREEVLLEARRIVSPDGQLIITMIPPRVSAIWHILRRRWDADQHERGMKPGEVYGLTRKQIHRLLTEAGFRVVSERRFMGGFNTLTIARAGVDH